MMRRIQLEVHVLSVVDKSVEINARAARAITLAMRDVARADGVHEAEEQLINAFEADLGDIGTADEVDLTVLNSLALKEVFLKSLILVALADGVVSEEEEVLINKYAADLGLSKKEITYCMNDVASAMLSQLAGVKVFREQAVELGRALKLDEFSIQKALES